MPAFYNAKGWLTPYGMACGYIHQTECANGSVQFNREGAGCYSVTVWNSEARGVKDKFGQNLRDGIEAYESFEHVTEARAAYARHVKAKNKTLSYRYESNAAIARSVIQ